MDTVNIQWFPGHMKKAQRMIEENLRLVDAVCEILDARIPLASQNPDVKRLTEGKPRLIVLNRADIADPKATSAWRSYFRECGLPVLETDSKSGRGVGGLAAALRELLADKLKEYETKGQAGRPLRAMVLGIPNVGKSTFINKAAKKKAAKTSDRPGVTRGKQWITAGAGLELLDTPGILWPRFDSKDAALNLAFTGAIKDEIMDTEDLAARLLVRLAAVHPEGLERRYKLLLGEPAPVSRPQSESKAPMAPGHELLEMAAKSRGFLRSGGVYDTERMAAILLDEFRAGLIGRITLEMPPE